MGEGVKSYLEVTVFVSPGTNGSYTVRVESRHGGVAGYPLMLPFALGDLAGIVTGVAASVREIGEAATPATNPERGLPVPAGRRASIATSGRDFGAEMFEALFKGPGLEVLAATVSRAKSLTNDGIDTGVRIRISMDLENHGMVEVAGLPWELISRKGDDPLVVSDKTPLVRSFDVLEARDSVPLKGALRILVVMSNPRGTPPLNLETERTRIEQSWRALGMTVDFARPVRADLRKQLGAEVYHVVHFMGHGDFDLTKGGMLLLEKNDGEPDPISGKEFAVMLQDEPLRLVYLNACKTGMAGMTGTGSPVHPFAGVASALIKKGVPAVVAMQFPISDEAAIAFATTFYERIAQRFPVEAAVAQARSALYQDGHSEWVTPVLYLRSSDGVLFDPSAEPAHAAAAGVASAAAAPAATTSGAADLWEPGADDAARIFLAASCKELKSLQRTLGAELRALGHRVVDSVPPPDDAAGHETTVRALAARADLCVHLMGDTPGKSIGEPGALRTYPVEQLRIALESARAQLVIIPDVDLDTIEDAEYQQYLVSLKTRTYDAGRFELVQTSKLEVKAAITASLQRQKDARSAAATRSSAGDPVLTAFVDAHELDQDVANELVTFLSTRDVEAFFQTSDGSTDDALRQLGDNIKNYPLYILVTGKADKEFVTNHANKARTSANASRRQILIARYESGDDPAIDLSRLKITSALKRPTPNPVDAMFKTPAEPKS